MSGKRWFRSFLLLSAALLALLMLACYCVDPFMQFRASDGKYYLSSRFVGPGLMKTAEYDAAVVGSSVTQNFNMQSFRDQLGVNPIKATIGGMSVSEQADAINRMDAAGKARTYYICMDNMAFLVEPENDARTYPDYLMNDDPRTLYRYLLGYEAWLRFIPVDAALCLCDALGIRFGDKITHQRSVDYLEYWQEDRESGAEPTWQSFGGVNDAPLDSAYAARLTAAVTDNMEAFLTRISLNADTRYVFFFPPYSALYWFSCGRTLTLAHQNAKAWFVSRVAGMDNVTVFDFQAMELTLDPARYCDITHYAEDVNEAMVGCFASGDFRVDETNIAASIARMNALLETFEKENFE